MDQSPRGGPALSDPGRALGNRDFFLKKPYGSASGDYRAASFGDSSVISGIVPVDMLRIT